MKCLRCGREVRDRTAFCPQCSETAAIPLVPSAYMSKKVVIPKRKPAQKTKKPEVKKNRRELSRPRLLVCILSLLLSVALCLQLYYGYTRYTRAEAEVARLQSVENECVHLTDKLRQAENRIVELEEQLALEVGP